VGVEGQDEACGLVQPGSRVQPNACRTSNDRSTTLAPRDAGANVATTGAEANAASPRAAAASDAEKARAAETVETAGVTR
jgi:hypothetical protein